MRDLTAISALLQKDLFLKYSPMLLKLDNIQKEIQLVIKSISKYYDKYKDKESMSVTELQAFHNYLNPHPQDPHIYEYLFNVLRSIQIDNPDLLVDIMNRTVEEHIQTKVVHISTQVVEGTKSTGIEEVKELITDYDKIVGTVQEIEESVCTKSLKELLQNNLQDGLKWRLKFLNDKLGPLPKRTLGHIIARFDGGKTSIALSEMTYFTLQHVDRPLLYLSNEEHVDRVKARGYSALIGVSKDWLLANSSRAEEYWRNRGGDRIRFIKEVYDIGKVNQMMEYYKPRVCVIDQGPNVSIENKKLEGVARLKELYIQYRELANRYDCSVISLGQASVSAENKKLLTGSDMDASKTDIPGQCDWVLGIGKLEDQAYREVRWLNIIKNKLTGKYGNEQVMLHTATGRFED